MAEKILSAYERAVDDGLFNTDGAPAWAARDVGALEARCAELERMRKGFETKAFPDDAIREEQVKWLNESVETLVSYVNDIWEKVQQDHDLLPFTLADHRRDVMEVA
ncbi:hypothetical protein [Acetobacter okinawensis]|uniref:Uncharacterized protein n=1 Tax=Acetobacter okinawensis TaxID=1076594 RepID=A0A252BYA7_9PROT|nr:hypothetical protein [Acetobacter okinawensis]MBS0988966.1 hypothetical protein [Acetobacter okinawensis]OUJ13837.1 hypothetical protein HK26_04145 [Acetobacter okinawensis]